MMEEETVMVHRDQYAPGAQDIPDIGQFVHQIISCMY